MSQKRDTDYLAVSTRIHAMENRMLTRERMERMIDAKDSGEAAKVLSECGYGELTQLTSAALEELLADGTHSRSSKFSEFADCFSRNKRSFLYVGIYYLTKIFFALLALDFVILEPDLSNATIL